MTELNLEGYIAQEAARVAADYNFRWTVTEIVNIDSNIGVKVKFETVIAPVLCIEIIFEVIDFKGKSKQSCYDFITAGLEEAAEKLDNEEADMLVAQWLEAKK